MKTKYRITIPPAVPIRLAAKPRPASWGEVPRRLCPRPSRCPASTDGAIGGDCYAAARCASRQPAIFAERPEPSYSTTRSLGVAKLVHPHRRLRRNPAPGFDAADAVPGIFCVRLLSLAFIAF